MSALPESARRVQEAAHALGLHAEVRLMPASTRTAGAAAGTPQAVFAADPQRLCAAVGAQVIAVS